MRVTQNFTDDNDAIEEGGGPAETLDCSNLNRLARLTRLRQLRCLFQPKCPAGAAQRGPQHVRRIPGRKSLMWLTSGIAADSRHGS